MGRDVIMEKIAFADNLEKIVFTKTLSTRVFNGHRDKIGVICISNML